MSDPKDLKKQNKQTKPVIFQQTAISVGPIPQSSEFGAYETILPGSADRILTMAEKNQEMNHYALRAAVEYDRRVHNTARMVILIVLVGGFVLALIKGDVASYAILIGALATLLASFIFNKKTEKSPPG